ncbi:MAG: radical protein, partial [Paenibacillaceae bacterium]|nr:radical protein [Paenibacillaceae bacterium]
QELHGAGKFHYVFGLAYRNRNSEIVLNPGRPKLELDDIPSPHRFPEDVPGLANRVVYFETSRGCPFSCQFCLSSIESGVRYFDIERTKRDLLYLIESGAKLIKFVDRTFNIKKEYAMEVFKFLIEHHRGCVFQFEITADIMRPEVLVYLAEHAPPGTFRFEIGVQSTNDETNSLVKRRQNFAKLSRTVSIIRDSGNIAQHLDLIAGLPEEDYDSFRQTFNDVYALRPEELQLGFLKMLRGTGLRNDAEKYGYKYMDRAPYEVLRSNALPFEDILRIKRVEDVLDKYWNAHRMDRTIRYLVRHEFASAFDFYQEFGDYWEERGWQRIGHQLEDLFTRLRSFLVHRGTEQLDVIEGFMKLDYFLNHKYKPRKIWWNFSLNKRQLTDYMKMLAERPHQVSAAFAELGAGEKELHKHAVIEVLPFDLVAYITDGRIDQETHTLVAVYYPPDGQATPSWHMLRLDEPAVASVPFV